jgi:hypothetical protein
MHHYLFSTINFPFHPYIFGTTQEISGHNDLGTLQRYLAVSPEQKRNAVAVIGF